MKTLSLVLSLLLVAQSAAATEWHTFGPRAMGMGGVGVALAQGPVGVYWNPAGLGQVENPWGVQIPFSGNFEMTGSTVEGANDLNQVVKACTNGTADCTNANIQAALNKLNRTENGLRGDFSMGLAARFWKVAVFANNIVFVGARPNAQVDLNNTTTSVQNNLSKVILRGLNLTEFGVGFGHEVPGAPGLLLGGTLKGIIGRVGYHEYSPVAGDFESTGLGEFERSSKQSFQPGIDAGLLWDINRTFEKVPFRPRIGVTGRNINNPQFDAPDSAISAGERAKFSLEGNVRAGAAISPFRFWTIAADFDVVENPTALDGIKSQTVGIGTEINVFNRSWINIPLRAGLRRNIAIDGSKTSLTGGFGVNLLHMTADLGFQMSPAKSKVQTIGEETEIPTQFAFSAQLGLLFGGKKE